MSDDKQGAPELPAFKSINEIAEFFDSRSTEDFNWEPVNMQTVREREVEDATGKAELVHVSLRLPRQDVEELKRAASRAGVGYTTFIRIVLRKAVGR